MVAGIIDYFFAQNESCDFELYCTAQYIFINFHSLNIFLYTTLKIEKCEKNEIRFTIHDCFMVKTAGFGLAKLIEVIQILKIPLQSSSLSVKRISFFLVFFFLGVVY